MLAADTDGSLLAADRPNQRLIEWTIAACEEKPRTERPPLNMALCVAHDGPEFGEHLDHLTPAINQFVLRRHPGDRLALVVYNPRQRLFLPSEPIGEDLRALPISRPGMLQSGNGSSLYDCWLEGCAQVLAQKRSPGLNRLLLAVDGLPVQAAISLDAWLAQVLKVRTGGVITSTCGFGAAPPEGLLRTVATQGGGCYYRVSDVSLLSTVVQEELHRLLTQAAGDVLLAITAPPNTTVELLGTAACWCGQLQVDLGAVSFGECRRLYTRLHLPPVAAGAVQAVGGELRVEHAEKAHRRVAHAEHRFLAVPATQLPAHPVDGALLRRAEEAERGAWPPEG